MKNKSSLVFQIIFLVVLSLSEMSELPNKMTEIGRQEMETIQKHPIAENTCRFCNNVNMNVTIRSIPILHDDDNRFI